MDTTLFDVVRCNDITDADWIVYKFPSETIKNGSTLITEPGQKALCVQNGKIVGEFENGSTIISTERYPFLSKIVDKMHGGDNTFPCEVYFINTTLQPECTWGTKAPAAIKDPETQLIVHIRAFGSYVIRIGDPQFLLNCLVGFVNGGEFVSYTKLIDKLDGIIQQTVQQAIGDTISKNKVTVMELPSECENFSETMKEKCVPYFAKYGFEMTDFTTGSINFPDEDLEAYKKKSELEMLGTTYERNRGLDIQEKWAGNEGTAGGLATAGIGVAMGMNAVKGGAPFNPAADVSEAPKETTKTKCISCGKEIPIGCKFCPECGAKQTSVCPKCGKPLPPGVKFCPECGQPIAGGNNNEANK